jgi:predicted LPLAT superfamily acyltransferase
MKTETSGASHWSEQKEAVSGYAGLKFVLIVFRFLPVAFLRVCMFPVSFFFFVFAKKARVESRRFLYKVADKIKTETSNKKLSISLLKHITSFSLTLIDKVEAWGGKFPLKRIRFQEDDIQDLIERLDKKEGALLICSHLGNAELLRGLASFNRTGVSREVQVISVVDFSGTANFNKMLKELNPASMTNLVSANNIGPDTIIQLQECIAAGGLVVIAGDRTSANTRGRYFSFPFLGEDAPFAYGVFFLAALLKVPSYFVFALRQKDITLFPKYNMHVHKSLISFDCSRKERDERIADLAHNFSKCLEGYCKQYPYQWYNFYDFWSKPEASK